MHSAPLPVYEHFLPKERQSGPPTSTIRLWRTNLRRRPPTYVAKRIMIFLTLVLLIVKLIVVPFKSSGRHSPSSKASFDVSGVPGAQPSGVLQIWAPQVEYYSFADQTVSSQYAANRQERLLLCMPLRNAEDVLDIMFEHLRLLTYDHNLIDIAFLVSDSTDDTFDVLVESAKSIQQGNAEQWKLEQRFNRIDIYKHDFGATIGQGVDARHGVAVQAARRKLMGRARNWLLTTALKPYHSWVYWRDADIERSPTTILEDLMQFDRDVIVPNVWRPLPSWLGGQQPYDLNSWQESDAALKLAASLDPDDVIVEGYAEYPTWRVHLAYLRNDEGKGDINEIMDLDGIGGVSILAKAKVFRAGANFPGFAFLSHVETEGFGKMCRRMQFSVAGLAQYTVWHRYEPSDDDLEKINERLELGLPID